MLPCRWHAHAQSIAKARNKLKVDGKCKPARRKVSIRVTLTRRLLRGLAKSRGSISVGQWSGKHAVRAGFLYEPEKK